MKGKTEVIRSQNVWANKKGINTHELNSGYANDAEDNLFNGVLSKEAKKEFEMADGSELKDAKTRPAKIKAFHSSSALVYNVFEYWRNIEKVILANALNLNDEITKLTLEKRLETGISTPNIDIFLWLKNKKAVAIESKFCEWMSSKKDKKFKERYFWAGSRKLKRWEDAGLPKCQSLANEIQFNGLSFNRLDATQLLKHALGIGYSKGIDAQLIYLYYDLENEDSRIGNDHRDELDEFTDRIEGELNFKHFTYQNMIKELKGYSSEVGKEYLEYLQKRYFS